MGSEMCIRDRWGFVNKAVVQDDATRISRTLQPVANTVGALYADESGDEQFSGWITSTRTKNYNPIGNKELLVELRNTSESENITNDNLLEILKPFESPSITLETSRQDTTGASLECVGWGETLNWQHVPYRDRGRIGDVNIRGDAPSTIGVIADTNDGRSGIRVAQFINFNTTDYPDDGEENQYMHRIIVPLRLGGYEVFNIAQNDARIGNFSLEIWSSNGENPQSGETITAPIREINQGPRFDDEQMSRLVGAISGRDGGFVDVAVSYTHLTLPTICSV